MSKELTVRDVLEDMKRVEAMPKEMRIDGLIEAIDAQLEEEMGVEGKKLVDAWVDQSMEIMKAKLKAKMEAEKGAKMGAQQGTMEGDPAEVWKEKCDARLPNPWEALRSGKARREDMKAVDFVEHNTTLETLERVMEGLQVAYGQLSGASRYVYGMIMHPPRDGVTLDCAELHNLYDAFELNDRNLTRLMFNLDQDIRRLKIRKEKEDGQKI